VVGQYTQGLFGSGLIGASFLAVCVLPVLF
jgi:hypothetical protein